MARLLSINVGESAAKRPLARRTLEPTQERRDLSAIADHQHRARRTGRAATYVGVFTDISQIKQSEERLEHLAHYDPLTDLPNRLLVQSRLQHAIERAERHGDRVAALSIDLDRFKTVNDSLGHPVGDELLAALAQRPEHAACATRTPSPAWAATSSC